MEYTEEQKRMMNEAILEKVKHSIKVEDLINEDWQHTNVEGYTSGVGFYTSHYQRSSYGKVAFNKKDFEVNNDGVCILRKKNNLIPDYDGSIAVPYNKMEYVNLKEYKCLGLSKDLKLLGKSGKKVSGCVVIQLVK